MDERLAGGMARTPEVSVVIPTKDRWRLLSASLAGALQQERVELEVVVVDDGSTDETPRRLAEISDPRVSVRRHEHSRGVSGARNAGLATARGDWVAFLDDDDLWSPNKLRRQLDVSSAAGAVFGYAAAVVLDENRDEVLPDEPVPDPNHLAELLLRGNAIPGGCSNVVARTDVVRRAGCFDEKLSMLADWDLWLRLADAGPAAACDEVLVAYRRHTRNMTVTDLEHIRREVDYFAAKQAAAREMSFDRVAYSRWLAKAATPVTAARIYLRTGIAYRSFGNVALAAATLLGVRSLARAARSGRRALRDRTRGSSTSTAAPSWLTPSR